MKKIIKVSFAEQSKSVVSDVSITYELDGITITNDEICAETEALFKRAQDFALNATFKRNK
jgi:hypothetical protein